MNIISIAESTGRSILTWEWTKKLLHWLIISAGTISECAFLIASLWMSVNASVHPLVLLFIDDTTSQHLTELATAAYVALPELILGLAFVTTIGHVRLWLYNRRNYSAAIWTVLYGLPTLVFLVLSLITLGCSVTSVNFRLPEPLIVVRALAGYMFAFTSLLYTQLGVPQEKDKLQKKDDLLAVLRQEKDAMIAELSGKNAQLQEIVQRQNAELQEQKELLAESKNTQLELPEEKSDAVNIAEPEQSLSDPTTDEHVTVTTRYMSTYVRIPAPEGFSNRNTAITINDVPFASINQALDTKVWNGCEMSAEQIKSMIKKGTILDEYVYIVVWKQQEIPVIALTVKAMKSVTRQKVRLLPQISKAM